MLSRSKWRGPAVTRVGFAKYMAVLIGGISLSVAVSSALNTRAFVAGAVHADGAVIDLVRPPRCDSTSNAVAPLVRFQTADGETIEFRSDTASDPPSYSRGERVGVWYRPLAPRDARVDDFESLWASSVMFGATGSIIFGIGVAWVAWSIALARKAADLKRRGKRLATTVLRVEMNENVRVQGLHPYRVFTQWRDPATAAARTFESEYVWVDPTPYLDGRTVTVFVDPSDPSRYYVDLEFVDSRAAVKSRASVASLARRRAAQRVS
jgi:hypothetical protein